MILLIDNYDSFVYNLARYLHRLGQCVEVVRNDAAELSLKLPTSTFDGGVRAIVLSPGPRRPEDAAGCVQIVQQLSGIVPILGVCLGHQVIYRAFGGRVVRAARVVHGRSTPIRLASSPLFDGLGSEQQFARYHSLIAEPRTLPACLRATAWSQDNEIMAVEHRRDPTFGVQFHPESVLSPAGYGLLRNFLRLADLPVPEHLPAEDLAADAVQCGFSPRDSIENENQEVPVALPPARSAPSHGPVREGYSVE